MIPDSIRGTSWEPWYVLTKPELLIIEIENYLKEVAP